MEIAVLLEPLDNNGFRATSLTPGGLAAEGPTRGEALDRLHDLVSGQLARAELVKVHVPLASEPHCWRALAGSWKDHPDAEEVERNMQEYRRQVDDDPERLLVARMAAPHHRLDEPGQREVLKSGRAGTVKFFFWPPTSRHLSHPCGSSLLPVLFASA
jgi:hypothetical protein